MTDNLPNDTPHEGWTLDELGRFAQRIAKRTAHDAWLLGRAYTIAKKKAKAEGKRIDKWRKEWLPFLSQPTLSRYEAVSRLTEDEVRDKGLTDVYRLLGAVPQKSPPAPDKGLAESATTRKVPAPNEERTTSPTEPAPHKNPASGGTPKVVQPEPDSLLMRVAKVATLVRLLVNDLSDLDAKADDAQALDEALHDAIDLLNRLRSSVGRKEAA